MSVRDEGKTHHFGDDCPGGHRAAGVAGVDWDDQETADEANAREAAERSGSPVAGARDVVTDEMVQAYDRAYESATEFFAPDEMEVGNPFGIRAGLAAALAGHVLLPSGGDVSSSPRGMGNAEYASRMADRLYRDLWQSKPARKGTAEHARVLIEKELDALAAEIWGPPVLSDNSTEEPA